LLLLLLLLSAAASGTSNAESKLKKFRGNFVCLLASGIVAAAAAAWWKSMVKRKGRKVLCFQRQQQYNGVDEPTHTHTVVGDYLLIQINYIDRSTNGRLNGSETFPDKWAFITAWNSCANNYCLFVLSSRW